MILGDHPHVVEPAERIHGKWVIYSMGNQISRHEDPILRSREGAMPLFTFTEARPGRLRVTRAEDVPTLMLLHPRLRLIDLRLALRDSAVGPHDRAKYERSIRHVRRTLDLYGARRQGLVVP